MKRSPSPLPSLRETSPGCPEGRVEDASISSIQSLPLFFFPSELTFDCCSIQAFFVSFLLHTPIHVFIYPLSSVVLSRSSGYSVSLDDGRATVGEKRAEPIRRFSRFLRSRRFSKPLGRFRDRFRAGNDCDSLSFRVHLSVSGFSVAFVTFEDWNCLSPVE